jgi:hypothetical protein
MDGFEAAEGEVGVDLGGGDVGVAEEELDGAEVGAVLDHVGGATVAEGVRAGGAVVALDEEPDGLTGERHAAQGEEETCAVGGVGFGADAGEMWATFLEVEAEGVQGGEAEGDDAFLVSFAADEDAAEVEREVAGREAGDF